MVASAFRGCQKLGLAVGLACVCLTETMLPCGSTNIFEGRIIGFAQLGQGNCTGTRNVKVIVSNDKAVLLHLRSHFNGAWDIYRIPHYLGRPNCKESDRDSG